MKIFLLLFALFTPLATIVLRKVWGLQFTKEVKDILAFSFDFADKSKINDISPELVLRSIIRHEIGVAFQILKTHGFKAEIFIVDFETMIGTQAKPENNSEAIGLSQPAQNCLSAAAANAKKNRSNVNSGYLLKSIVASESISVIADKYHIPSSDSINLILQNPEFKTMAKLEKPTSLIKRITNNFF